MDEAEVRDNADFEDIEVKRVCRQPRGAKVYYVSVVNGKVVERVVESELISSICAGSQPASAPTAARATAAGQRHESI